MYLIKRFNDNVIGQTLLNLVKTIRLDGEQVECLLKLLKQSTYDTEAELFLQLLQQYTPPQMMRKHLQKVRNYCLFL